MPDEKLVSEVAVEVIEETKDEPIRIEETSFTSSVLSEVEQRISESESSKEKSADEETAELKITKSLVEAAEVESDEVDNINKESEVVIEEKEEAIEVTEETPVLAAQDGM